MKDTFHTAYHDVDSEKLAKKAGKLIQKAGEQSVIRTIDIHTTSEVTEPTELHIEIDTVVTENMVDDLSELLDAFQPPNNE